MNMILDDEAAEEQLAIARFIINSGYIDLAHFERRKHEVILGLTQYGDRFAMSLGLALSNAEMQDAVKIMRYWQQLCDEYALIYQIAEAKRKATA